MREFNAARGVRHNGHAQRC